MKKRHLLSAVSPRLPATANNSAKSGAKRPVRDSLTLPHLHTLAESWLLDGKIGLHSPQTEINRRYLLGRLDWYLTGHQLSVCGEAECRAFFAYIATAHQSPEGRWGSVKLHPAAARPPRPATLRTYYALLQQFFNWCVAQEHLDVSPLAKIAAPAVRQDQIRPFTHQEIEGLLSAARRSMAPRRDEAIVCLLFDTGLRASEMLSLTRGDIDPVQREVRVKGKGNKYRSVPYGKRAAKALRAYLIEIDTRTSDYGHDVRPDTAPLWASLRGSGATESLTTNGLRQLIERLGKTAGLSSARCSPHTLRHSFAVSFLRNGGSELTLMRLLGHSDLTMTSRNVKFAEADIQEQHRRFSPADRL